MTRLRTGVLRLIGVACLCIGSATAADRGVNFGWVHLDGCNRQPFSTLGDSANLPDVLDAELHRIRQSFSAIRLPLFFDQVGGVGILSSQQGLRDADRQRYTDLLARVARQRFARTVVGFFPLAESFAARWPAFDPDRYAINRRFIEDVIRASGSADLWFDLGNEHVPEGSQPVLLAYAQQLIADIRQAFPRAKIGFSSVGKWSRFGALAALFHEVTPDFFDLHVYDDAENVLDAFAQSPFHRQHPDIPLIIGETYADAAYADAVGRAATRRHLDPMAVLEWPLSRDKRCKDVDTVFGAP